MEGDPDDPLLVRLGEVIKRELLEPLWPSTFVEQANLSHRNSNRRRNETSRVQRT